MSDAKHTPANVAQAVAEVRCIGIAVEPTLDGGETIRARFISTNRDKPATVEIAVSGSLRPAFVIGDAYDFGAAITAR